MRRRQRRDRPPCGCIPPSIEIAPGPATGAPARGAELRPHPGCAGAWRQRPGYRGTGCSPAHVRRADWQRSHPASAQLADGACVGPPVFQDRSWKCIPPWRLYAQPVRRPCYQLCGSFCHTHLNLLDKKVVHTQRTALRIYEALARDRVPTVKFLNGSDRYTQTYPQLLTPVCLSGGWNYRAGPSI